MKLELKIFKTICQTEKFLINGIEANSEDFGIGYDCEGTHDGNEDDDVGCVDYQFFPKLPSQKILRKYNINKKEDKEICDKLEEGLSFGCCKLCNKGKKKPNVV